METSDVQQRLRQRTSPEFSPFPTSTSEPTKELNLTPVRPKMFLVDERYEPINEVDSDVQDSDDKYGSVDADDVTQPDDTDKLSTTGSSITSTVLGDETTLPPSNTPSTPLTTDPYDSEEETKPLNLDERRSDDTETDFTDESDFETADRTFDSDYDTTSCDRPPSPAPVWQKSARPTGVSAQEKKKKEKDEMKRIQVDELGHGVESIMGERSGGNTGMPHVKELSSENIKRRHLSECKSGTKEKVNDEDFTEKDFEAQKQLGVLNHLEWNEKNISNVSGMKNKTIFSEVLNIVPGGKQDEVVLPFKKVLVAKGVDKISVSLIDDVYNCGNYFKDKFHPFHYNSNVF